MGASIACVAALFRALNSAVTSLLRAASFASSSAEEGEPGSDIVTRRRVMEKGAKRLHTTPYGVLLNRFRGLKGWCERVRLPWFFSAPGEEPFGEIHAFCQLGHLLPEGVEFLEGFV